MSGRERRFAVLPTHREGVEGSPGRGTVGKSWSRAEERWPTGSGCDDEVPVDPASSRGGRHRPTEKVDSPASLQGGFGVSTRFGSGLLGPVLFRRTPTPHLRRRGLHRDLVRRYPPAYRETGTSIRPHPARRLLRGREEGHLRQHARPVRFRARGGGEPGAKAVPERGRIFPDRFPGSERGNRRPLPGEPVLRPGGRRNRGRTGAVEGPQEERIRDRLLAGRKTIGHRGGKTVRVWDVETGAQTRLLEGHSKNVYALAFGPHGKILVSGGLDGTARIWNLPSGTPRAVLSPHTRYVSSVAVSPDRRWVVTTAWDGDLRFWNCRTGQRVRRVDAHTGTAWSSSFHPDGRRLATAGKDGRVLIWGMGSGEKKER